MRHALLAAALHLIAVEPSVRALTPAAPGARLASRKQAEGRSPTARRVGPRKAPRLTLRERAPSKTGHVQFITDQRAYLDRGTLDGLVEGQMLQLVRAGRPVVRCAVDRVADHVAVCRGPDIRAGDVFRVRGRLERPAGAATPPLPSPAEPALVDARARVLAKTRFPKVDFSAGDRRMAEGGASIRVGVAAWSGGASATDGAGAGGSLAAQVDGRVERLRLGETDLRADLAFTAVRWQLRPDPARFAPGVRTQFLLWEAEVSRREIGDRTVLALGRIWPWHLPGLGMLDGLQVGRRSSEGDVETGVYLGTVPTAETLAPTLGAWAGGAYAALVHAPHGAGTPAANLEARVGARHSEIVGQVRDAELLGQAWGRTWGVGGGARAYQVRGRAGPPQLELAQVYLHVRDREPIGGWLQARYMGPRPDDGALLRDELPSRFAEYHAAFGLRLDVSAALGLALSADAHRSLEAERQSTDARLELRLPRLFAETGGLWLAATATQGWVRSRGGYVQFLGAPFASARVLARIAARTTAFDGPDATSDATEVDGFLQVDTAVGERWRVRARSSVALPLSVQAQPPTSVRVAYQAAIDALTVF